MFALVSSSGRLAIAKCVLTLRQMISVWVLNISCNLY